MAGCLRADWSPGCAAEWHSLDGGHGQHGILGKCRLRPPPISTCPYSFLLATTPADETRSIGTSSASMKTPASRCISMDFDLPTAQVRTAGCRPGPPRDDARGCTHRAWPELGVVAAKMKSTYHRQFAPSRHRIALRPPRSRAMRPTDAMPRSSLGRGSRRRTSSAKDRNPTHLPSRPSQPARKAFCVP